MRHLFGLGAVALVAIACGGTSSIGEGRGGANDAGTGGSASSGGGSGSGGDSPGSGGGGSAGCKSPGDCAVPEICKQCADGSTQCAEAACVNGQCSTVFPACGGGGGSACTVGSDCVQYGAPCTVCPGGTPACPKVECVNGECVGSMPSCSGYVDAGVAPQCRTAAECAVPDFCEICPDGSYSCASAVCVNGTCNVQPPACGGGECTSDSQCMAPAVCQMCADGSYSCARGVCTGGKCETVFPACGTAGDLRWYKTCGDIVCRDPGTYDAGSTVPPCDPKMGETSASPCKTDGRMCDPGWGCGVMLLCTTKDPATMCPISRAKYKEGIEYLSSAEREKLASDVQSIPLVRYRYKDAPAREHLGFIIEDVEPSPSVDSKRDQVDLYGYTSMTVAALQQQHLEIEALRSEVKALRAELSRRPARR